MESGQEAGGSAAELVAGRKVPDLDLPDHTGRQRRLSEIAGGDPVVVVFSRGWWCPKEQRFMRRLVALQEEFHRRVCRARPLSA